MSWFPVLSGRLEEVGFANMKWMRKEDSTVFTSLVWAVVRGDGVRSGHIMNA